MTKTIKIAFYNSQSIKTFFGRVIRWKQERISDLPLRHARYTHVELVFDDGWYYSSSDADGGTRRKRIIDDKGHWDYIPLSVTDEEYHTVLNWCDKNLGNRYNWIGIFFAQGLKTLWLKKEGDFFCSEFCVRALQTIKILCGVDAVFVSPGQMHYMIEQPNK